MLNFLSSIYELVAPAICPCCGRALTQSEGLICVDCRFDLPYTYDHQNRDNPAFQMLDSFHPVVWAGSLCYYHSGDKFSNLIHSIKYRRQKRVGAHLGTIFATEILESSSLPEPIDVVIAVPLHKYRHLWRGYNQSEYIARSMAKVLGCSYEAHCVKRVVNTATQARLKSRRERMANTERIFRVVEGEKLDNRHILIVDDVLTTGSTIKSLIDLIINSCEGCRVSVATLARTEKY